MPQTDRNSEQITLEMVTVSDLSDQDILIQYCLQNKVNKVAVDELLKRGFDSLDALKLVAMEDLSLQNIPMGQRRLIHHLAQALKTNEGSSGLAGNATTMTSATGGNAGVSLQTSGITTGNTTVEGGSIGVSLSTNQPAQQISVGQDFYNQALLHTLLSQQAQLANAGQSSDSVQQTGNSNISVHQTASVNQGPQPSWSDPQVHIASATGKSASAYLNICDFVPHSVEEDVVVGVKGNSSWL